MDNEQLLNESINKLSDTMEDLRCQMWNPYSQPSYSNIGVNETNNKLDKIISLLEQLNNKINVKENENA